MAWKKCYGCKRKINPHHPWQESFIQVSFLEKTVRKHCHIGCNSRTARLLMYEREQIKYKVKK